MPDNARMIRKSAGKTRAIEMDIRTDADQKSLLDTKRVTEGIIAELKPYVVCYRSCAVFGAKICMDDPDGIDLQTAELMPVKRAELYVGIIKAASSTQAIRITSEREGCHEACLIAYPIE